MDNRDCFEFELAEYVRKQAAANVEFDLWKKVGFGVSIGLLAMAAMLGQWNSDEFGIDPPALRIASGAIPLIFFGYFIRHHFVKKKLSKRWLALPLEVRERHFRENGQN